MPNPYNSEVGQQQKSGGQGHKEKPRGSKPSDNLKMKTAGWPGTPGKSGPKRNTTNAKPVKQYAASSGL
jgi:hypothetical protein